MQFTLLQAVDSRPKGDAARIGQTERKAMLLGALCCAAVIYGFIQTIVCTSTHLFMLALGSSPLTPSCQREEKIQHMEVVLMELVFHAGEFFNRDPLRGGRIVCGLNFGRAARTQIE